MCFCEHLICNSSKNVPNKICREKWNTHFMPSTLVPQLTDLKIIKQNNFFLLSPYNLGTNWFYKTLYLWPLHKSAECHYMEDFKKLKLLQVKFISEWITNFKKIDTHIWWWKTQPKYNILARIALMVPAYSMYTSNKWAAVFYCRKCTR